MVSLPLSTSWKCISTKEIDCPYSDSDQHHVTWRAEMPRQIQDDTPSLICQTYSIQWNSQGLPQLRLEKVDNFSIFLNLAFIFILPQRNIKWEFSCNEVRKENLKHFAWLFCLCMKLCLSCQPFTATEHVSVHWKLFHPAQVIYSHI
jgi:hypothetical protein